MLGPAIIIPCVVAIALAVPVLHAHRVEAHAQPVVHDEVGQLRDRARDLSEHAGRHREALPLLDRAYVLASRGGDLEAQARIDLQRAIAHRGVAEPALARAAVERARAMAVRLDQPELAVTALTLLATLAAEAGDIQRAGVWLREAEPLAARVADRAVLASLLDVMGRNARDRGANDDSLRYHARAIEAADAAGAFVVGIRSRTARSATYLGLGRFDEALADAQEAFAIARDKEPRMRPAAAFGLAQAHAHVWNLDRAAELWTEAIEAYREIGPPIGVALALRQRMDTWYAMGDLARAAEDGAQALALFTTTGSSGAEPGLLARLALIASRRGDAAMAADYARRAGESAREGPDRRFVDNDLGLVAWRLGDLDAAGRRFDAVFARARALGDPEYEWRARYGLGRVALARGRPGEARAHFEGAVAVVERMRRELPEAGLRAAFLSDRNMAYEALVTALLADRASDAGRVREALAVAERAQSRSLADLLAESQQRVTDPRLDAVRAEERRFSARLSALQTRILDASDPAARDALLAELREAEHDYDAMVVRVRRENPAYAGLVYPEPLSADDLEALLGPDEALIAFLFDEDRGFAWIVRRGRIDGYPIPGRDTLEGQTRLITSLVAGRDAAGVRELGRHLYDALLGPARTTLDGVRRLVIVPAGPLQRLPFALLRSPADRWLFDEHAVSLAPSATVLAEIRRRPVARDARPLLAFAAAPEDAPRRSLPIFAPAGLPATGLPHSDAEVHDVARLLAAGDVRRDGPRRLEAEVKQAHGAYRVLHFATHAVIDEMVPRRSAILLGAGGDEDGLLQMNEIPNLAIETDLVVLATCRSHIGRALDGEGLLGLSRAFMRAGSRTVLATLWEVDDAETRRLMQAFYTALGDGEPPDRALGQAQREMIRAGGRGASPDVWAAFVVTGDASRVLFDRRPRSWSRLAMAGVLIGAGAVGAAWTIRRRRRAA